MFIKQEFKLEIFVIVCWNYSKWCILIVKRTVPLVDHSGGGVKVWIIVLLYKSTPSRDFFF